MKKLKIIGIPLLITLGILTVMYHIIFQPPYLTMLLQISSLILGFGCMVLNAWFLSTLIRDGDDLTIGPLSVFLLGIGAFIFMFSVKALFF